jgi:hypothetical protein
MPELPEVEIVRRVRARMLGPGRGTVFKRPAKRVESKIIWGLFGTQYETQSAAVDKFLKIYVN